MGILEMLDGEPICVVSANTKDFADTGGALHRDLRAEVVERGFSEEHVLLARGFDDFVERFVKPELELVEVGVEAQELNQAIIPTLREAILEELAMSLQYVPLEEELGLPSEFESPSIESIYSAENLVITDARRLEGGQRLVRVTARCEVEFDVFVFKADYYTMEGGDFRVSDPDWNDHYVTGSIMRDADLEITAVVDSEGAVSAIELESIVVVEDFDFS
jgi:hypothetical protein